MKIIGLCGGSGSGKGTVARLFSKYGFKTVDTDAVYHELVSKKSECLDALVSEFGSDILAADGSLDRKKLSEVVFKGESSALKRVTLNKIAHKYVLEQTKKILEINKKCGVVATLIDAPLLFESGFDKECDSIISVTADKSVRIKRILSRDGISESNAILRINSQLPDEYLIARSDYNIINNGTVSELSASVKNIAKLILEK